MIHTQEGKEDTMTFGWDYPTGVTTLPGEGPECSCGNDDVEDLDEHEQGCPISRPEDDPDRKRDQQRDASWEDVAYD